MLGKTLVLFFFGGSAYYDIEVLWRGYSHWTMAIVGGLLFVVVGLINEYLSWSTPLWKQCLIATVVILATEFVAGCIINLALGWNVWDYSDIPFNLIGQICLPFSVLWYLLSVVAIALDDFLRWLLFGEKFEGYKLF